MGSGADDAHDALTCRPVWTRHGRLRAWELLLHPERAVELPERERELAPLEEPRLAQPAWVGAVDGAFAVVVLRDEDLDRVWRHLGAADLGQVSFEALTLLRDEMRDRYAESCPEDAAADDSPWIEDELVIVACGRWYGARLPRQLLDECYAYELEPQKREVVSWQRTLPDAVARYADWLDERAREEVPHVPSPPRPCFEARPVERAPLAEARRWLDEELIPRVFGSFKRTSVG